MFVRVDPLLIDDGDAMVAKCYQNLTDLPFADVTIRGNDYVKPLCPHTLD